MSYLHKSVKAELKKCNLFLEHLFKFFFFSFHFVLISFETSIIPFPFHASFYQSEK